MKYRLKYVVVIMLVLISLLGLAGCSEVKEEPTTEKILVEYFYFNLCGSCDPETEFLDKFKTLTGVALNTPNLEIEFYNVHESDDMDDWEDRASQLGIKDTSIMAFPVLIINDELVKESKIDEVLGGDKFETIVNKQDIIIKSNATVIYYFSSPGCKDCNKAKNNVLDKLPSEVTIAGEVSPVQLIEVSIADNYGLMMFQTYCDEYYLPEEKQKTPLVFIGYTALSGVDEIESLPGLIEKGDGKNTLVLDSDDSALQEEENDFSIVGVFFTGLLNGLNPCAISMVLLLLSLLVVEKKVITSAGLMFALGKFIGFLLVGTLLFNVIKTLPLDNLALVVKIVLLVLSGAMVLLNANDILAAKNEKYQKIKLQLPKGLRKLNHDWIKKALSTKKTGLLIFSSLILGLLLSLGEFLCTGQIYLSAILHIAHSGAELSGMGFMYLVVYCVAFVLPLIVLVLLVSLGRNTFTISDKFRQNMVWIKLGNLLIFLLLFILVLFTY